MVYFAILAAATGFAIAIAAVGSAFGQGKAVKAAMEGISRQPEAAGSIQMALIIGLAFIEALTIYALVIAIMLFTKLPATETVLQAIREVTK
ncbi:MAG: ATP synthase F0 subunit C [bacterium]